MRRREAKANRQAELMRAALRPGLMVLEERLQATLGRLESQQAATQRLVEHLAAMPVPESPQLTEQREILLELLQALQPPADQVIAQRVGLSPLPISSPSSES